MKQRRLPGWLRYTVLLLAVFAIMLPLAAANAEETSAEVSVYARTVVNLRIRTGPGTGYAQIDTAPRGTMLPVLARTEDSRWLLIQHNGQQGWTAAWLTTLNGDVSAVPVSNGSTGTAPQQNGSVTAVPRVNLRMRSAASTRSRTLGTVPAGVAVPVTSRNAAGDWVQVSYNGRSGWVAAWYTTVNGDLNTVPVNGGSAAPAPPAAPAAPAASGDAAAMLQQINQVRCSSGMQPVVANAQLEAAARSHTQDMVSHNFFSHTGSNGSTLLSRIQAVGYSFSYVGENLAAGNSTVGATFQQWMNSPGHHDNMLNPAFNEAGLVHIAQPGTTYTHYWTLDLGARSGVTPPTCAQLGF